MDAKLTDVAGKMEYDVKRSAHNLLRIPKRYVRKTINVARRNGLCLTANDHRMVRYDDRHKGERCFLIGMGPSLSTEDLDKLKNEVCFACNKIYLAFDETDWRPTYYTVMDILVAENNVHEIDALQQPKIFPKFLRKRKIFSELDNVVWYGYDGAMKYPDGASIGFKSQILDGIYGGGYSVLLDQVQLAYFMGFEEVYVIGADFSFKVPTSTGEECASGEVLKSEGEVNHFHRDYRKKGETWTMPRLDMQEMAFQYARNAFERAGRKLVNVSRKTKLDVLERANLDDILRSPLAVESSD